MKRQQHFAHSTQHTMIPTPLLVLDATWQQHHDDWILSKFEISAAPYGYIANHGTFWHLLHSLGVQDVTAITRKFSSRSILSKFDKAQYYQIVGIW